LIRPETFGPYHVVAVIATVNNCTCRINSGPGSSVGIATDYGLDGPGIEVAASVV
jgi:hypothetical protein